MLTENTKDALTTIVELIEDDKFPARRNITDYAVYLLPREQQIEAEDYINLLYEERDKKKGGNNAKG